MKADAAPVPITRFQQAALILAMLAAFTEALTVAFNIGAIMNRFGASGAEAGFVATAQGLSVAVAALTGTRLIGRHPARKLVAIGLALVASGHALALVATGIPMLAAFQALGGLGTGLVVCVVMATAARTTKPEMTYGWINASVGAYLSLLALVVPRVLLAGGFEATYGLYALLALAGLLCLPGIPNSTAPKPLPPLESPAESPATGATSAHPRPHASALTGANAGWIALTGMGLLYFSIAGMGAFIERIGAQASVPLQTIGLAMLVGGLLTIVCPIAAGIVGARFGSTRPLLLVGGLMAITAWGLAINGTTAAYLASIPLWIVLPAILTPSFLGGLAVIDPTGRLAGAQPAFATLGGSMGPMTAGAVADASGYNGLGLFIIGALAIAISLMAAATLKADSIRRARASAPLPVEHMPTS